jgi:hypothetical protein
MYKKQVALQKVLCVGLLIVCALIFLYSLGIMTDLYDALYNTIRNPDKLDKTTVTGSRIYYDMQPFNKDFLHAAIGMILLCVLLFLTNTHSRRKYYAGNYAAVGLFTVGGVAFTVWAHNEIEAFKAQFLQINFEELAEHAAKKKSLYTDSTFWFDIHYLVCGVAIFAAVLLIVNFIWKKKMMQDEQKLLRSSGKAVSA